MTSRFTKRLSRATVATLSLMGSLFLSACSFGGQAATTLPTVPATSAANAAASTTVKATAVPTTIPSEIPTSAPKTAVPVTPAAPAAAATASANGAAMSGPRALAWNKDAKQLAWYSTAGSQPVLSGAAAVTMACGPTALWPSSDKLIVYHGGPTAPAQLVSLTDPSATPTTLGDSSALSCDLGRIAFSPNKKRLALLKYTSDITIAGAVAAGTFNVVSVADGTSQGSIDNVNTFLLENDGALLVHLIPNSKNQFDQADLGYWDAGTNKERFLERSIKSSDKCFFVSASVVHVADKVYTAFGENCTPPAGAGYRVLRTDFNGGNSINWLQRTGVGGNYFSYTNTNYLTVLPDNQTLLLAVPNGLKSRIANLLRVAIADATVTPLIQSAEMDSSPQNGPHRFQFNAQGTLLAFVIVNVNNGETLYVYDLTKPTQAPAAVTDANRSNQVTGLAWNAAGDRLIYTVTGDDASLSYFDLTAGRNLVTRGLFQGLALSADGQTAATVEQVKPSPSETRYNLVAVALADGTKTVLVSGDKGASAMDVLALR